MKGSQVNVKGSRVNVKENSVTADGNGVNVNRNRLHVNGNRLQVNGNGLEALDCLGHKFNFLGFIDDTPEKQGIHPYGFQVFSRGAFTDYPMAKVLAVPGSPANYTGREKIIESLQLNADRFTTVIHPAANVSCAG